MTKLDVVGGQEAALILEVEVPRIARWIKAGKMPPPLVVLDNTTPVWWRADIEAMKRGETTFQRHPKVRLVGLKGAADIVMRECGVSKRGVSRWRAEGIFPEPLLDKRDPKVRWEPGMGLAATPLWEEGRVERFAKAKAREYKARAA